jgi:hypothetical protein
VGKVDRVEGAAHQSPAHIISLIGRLRKRCAIVDFMIAKLGSEEDQTIGWKFLIFRASALLNFRSSGPFRART